MKRLILHIVLLTLLPAAFPAYGQHVSIAFYNTENMADTLDDPRTDDKDFTPEGRYRWDSEKYRTKIEHIARVVDDLNADVTGLCEIENENVLRDLMYAMRTSYNYIYRPTRDRRGMDIALLYRGDTFFPDSIRQAGARSVPREFLVVKGKLAGTEVVLIICHMPSQANKPSYRENAAKQLRLQMDKLQAETPCLPIIIMGDFNMSPDSYTARKILNVRPHDAKKHDDRQLYFSTPFTELSRKGYGSYIYKDKRQIFDWIAVTGNCAPGTKSRLTDNYGIFIRDYMVHTKGPKKGYPVRSFDSGIYDGGYSDHLPVFITLDTSQ